VAASFKVPIDTKACRFNW